MARDYWQTKRKAREIKKINKSLVLPTFSQQAFRDNYCVEIRASAFYHRADNVSHDVDNLTLEFWVKPTKSSLVGTWLNKYYSGTTLTALTCFMTTDDVFTARFTTTVDDYDLTTIDVAYHEWNYIAVTFDSTANEAKLYVNGVLKDTITTSGSLEAGDGYLSLGHATATIYGTNRYSEIRLWNETKTDEDIEWIYNKPRDTGGTVDTALTNYWQFTDGTGTAVTDVIGGNDITLSTGAEWLTDDYPPLIYGASYILAECSIDLSKTTSIVFPVIPPDDNNFGLCVSWTDSNGDFNRKLLFNASGDVGIDTYPMPEDYQGEKLENPFTLEVWNIDGNPTVDLEEELTIYVSDTTKPTTSVDETSVEAADVTWDTTLGEDYPWTFPLEFNDALTF